MNLRPSNDKQTYQCKESSLCSVCVCFKKTDVYIVTDYTYAYEKTFLEIIAATTCFAQEV